MRPQKLTFALLFESTTSLCHACYDTDHAFRALSREQPHIVISSINKELTEDVLYTLDSHGIYLWRWFYL